MTFKALMNISIKNGWLETIQETVGLQITVKCFEIFRITLFNIIYFEWQVFFLRFNWLRSLLAFGFLSQIQETITNTIPYIIEKKILTFIFSPITLLTIFFSLLKLSASNRAERITIVKLMFIQRKTQLFVKSQYLSSLVIVSKVKFTAFSRNNRKHKSKWKKLKVKITFAPIFVGLNDFVNHGNIAIPLLLVFSDFIRVSTLFGAKLINVQHHFGKAFRSRQPVKFPDVKLMQRGYRR